MTNEWLARVSDYFARRSARERMILLAGGLVLLVLIGYGMLYEPLNQARAKLAKRLPAERAELRLMRTQVVEIQRLRSRMGNSGQGGLEQRVKSSAAAFGFGDKITQFAVLANDQVQLRIQPLPTQTWLDWLSDMEQRGIRVVRCHITASEQTGLANLELTLTGNQQ
jgi:general secretion pathway protein M